MHKTLGPGLLESAYEECLCYELSMVGLAFKRQVELPVIYKGFKLDCFNVSVLRDGIKRIAKRF
ncbi:MAG: GxxExxY protein [bacterium]